jgi:hypothetical protein
MLHNIAKRAEGDDGPERKNERNSQNYGRPARHVHECKDSKINQSP